ncbi:hypothetical protein [Streptomyces sp. NBC_00038]|uniref:hypothetical protein n=1 Tax=Streptomyces sp. NBC_00038 TaxID=2903615 RepID=UPI00224FCE5D|nr:hypothetical protein [Streptomyces sp. NBC_00038]MCX5559889.1 hypothetical protein [Streptomyces sp. NBC_00038]
MILKPDGTPFQQHLLTSTQDVIRRFPESLKPEIYALSFRIWRIDYDERHPYVAIGYNTETQCGEQTNPEDPGEARWNYASWLLDGFEMLGNVPEDPVGSPLYVDEVKRAGLWFDGEYDFLAADLPEDEEDELDAKSDLLRLHFYDACIALARHLHTDGHLTEILGRPLPIVVFDMDCPGWEIEATEAANPPELIADYLAWQKST